jgi:UDP-N-acetylmuramoyl-tripeptide--D-alanyl-D-alanine ligase
MQFGQDFFASVIKEAEFYGAKVPQPAFFCVDSRKIKPNNIFVAINGHKSDGHDFIENAINLGAGGIIISETRQDLLSKLNETQKKNLFIAVVKDPQSALIKLATEWRLKFDIPIIGITGSVGKTSTKQILSNICDAAGINYMSAEGNQNTALGISMNMLKITDQHKLAIFEMGISKPGEMARMAQVVKPTIGVITCIGHSHMEGLGSLADIAGEKREIFKYFIDNNFGIINGDQPVLSAISYNHQIVKFGQKTSNQIQARKINISSDSLTFVLKLYNKKYNIALDSNNKARVMNALSASSVAHVLGIKDEFIISGITKPLSIPGRFDKKLLKNGLGEIVGEIINDAYNASPESMKAALEAFDKINFNGQKIAVIGDMLELGVNSSFWHRQIGRFLKRLPSVNQVLLVGNQVKWAQKTAPINIKIDCVLNWQEAVKILNNKLNTNSLVLVKASQGMQLQKLVEEFSQ